MDEPLVKAILKDPALEIEPGAREWLDQFEAELERCVLENFGLVLGEPLVFDGLGVIDCG